MFLSRYASWRPHRPPVRTDAAGARQPGEHRPRTRPRERVLSAAMDKTLIVTNDFPPRPGGIQSFVHSMALRMDPGQVVVYASTWKDGSEVARFDAEQPFPVVRDRTKMML